MDRSCMDYLITVRILWSTGVLKLVYLPGVEFTSAELRPSGHLDNSDLLHIIQTNKILNVDEDE